MGEARAHQSLHDAGGSTMIDLAIAAMCRHAAGLTPANDAGGDASRESSLLAQCPSVTHALLPLLCLKHGGKCL